MTSTAPPPCLTSSVSSSLSYHPSPAPSSPTSSTSSQSLRKRKRDEFLATPVPPLITPPPDSEDLPTHRPMYPLQIFTSIWGSLKSLAGIRSTGGDSVTGGDEVPESQSKRVRVDISSDDGPAPDDQPNKESIALATHPIPTQDSDKELPHSSTNNSRTNLRIKAPISIDKQAPPTQQLPSPLASSSEDEGEGVFKKALRPVRPLPPKMTAVLPPVVAGPLGQNEPPFFTKPLPKRNNPEAMLQRALDRRSAFGSSTYPRLPPRYQHRSSIPKAMGTPWKGMLNPTPSSTRTPQQIRDSLKTSYTSRHTPVHQTSTRKNQRRAAYSGRVEKSVREAYMKSKTLNLNELSVILDQLNREKVQGFQSLSEVEKRRKERAVEIERLKQKELEDKLREKIPPLTPEERRLYDRVMNEVRSPLVQDSKQYNAVGSKIPITKSDLTRLSPRAWLNDEVINFYLGMVADRANVDGEPKRVIAFNSFFFKNLQEGKNVSRWAKRQGAGGKDMLKLHYIIIPINSNGVHWVMAIVNLRQKRFEYYDSYRPGMTVKDGPFDLLRKYFTNETGEDLTSWTNYVMPNAPQQKNTNDCGVFSIKTAEVITRGGQMTFSQNDMQLLRQRLVVECVTGQLLPPVEYDEDFDDYAGDGDD